MKNPEEVHWFWPIFFGALLGAFFGVGATYYVEEFRNDSQENTYRASVIEQLNTEIDANRNILLDLKLKLSEVVENIKKSKNSKEEADAYFTPFDRYSSDFYEAYAESLRLLNKETRKRIIRFYGELSRIDINLRTIENKPASQDKNLILLEETIKNIEQATESIEGWEIVQ